MLERPIVVADWELVVLGPDLAPELRPVVLKQRDKRAQRRNQPIIQA